jgi:hypothetical protein
MKVLSCEYILLLSGIELIISHCLRGDAQHLFIYFLMKTYGINKSGLYKKKINCLVPQHHELVLTVKIERKQYTPRTRKAQIFIKARWTFFFISFSNQGLLQHSITEDIALLLISISHFKITKVVFFRLC